MDLDGLDAAILGPAFIAGLLVLCTHVPLGREVLRRGIIFIDLAIAQFAGFGVILAGTLGQDSEGFGVQAIAFSSAMLGALLLDLLERSIGRHQEALIGVSFILAATGSILLLANNPQGGEHLKELLVGQILWVESRQLLLPAVIAAVVLGIWWLRGEILKGRSFYVLFALSITASVQLIGVYLVFASLIVPALATITIKANRTAAAIAFLLGMVAYGLGLVVSALLDLPSGPMIVWAMAACGVLFVSLRTVIAR